jgi:hypothetical protein
MSHLTTSKSIILIDTSVFCNILNLPGYNQKEREVYDAYVEHVKNEDTLLLPMAVVLETGNHIAQISNGHERRKRAELFLSQIRDSISGVSPWTPTPFWQNERVLNWLPDFPDFATRQIGMGDLSIIKEWEYQHQLHRHRRVKIWSIDGDLDGYDYVPYGTRSS